MIFHKTILLNNKQMHYAEAPGPGPALLILHGLTGSHAEFLHLVPALSEHVHTYLLDMRGHGLSDAAEDGYQVPDYGREVVAFLERVVERPVIVLGHSLGGLVTAWLAANRPDLVKGVVLEDAPFYILQMPRFGQTGFYEYFTDLYNFLVRNRANGTVPLEELIEYVGGAPALPEQTPHSQAYNERVTRSAEAAGTPVETVATVAGADAVRERAIQLQQVDPATLPPTLEGTLFGGEEPDELLARVRCPVHLLAAQFNLSGAMDEQDLQRAIAQMPHATHAVIDNAGHDIHLDRPQDFLRELKQFMSTV